MSNRWFRKIAAIGALVGVSFAAFAGAAETLTGRATTVSKQLAIMSRILEKRLGDELKDQVITASMIQRGVQGFYVRGVGALFFVDVKFALAEPPKREPAAQPSKPGDLWDRYEQEIEKPDKAAGNLDFLLGQPSGGVWSRGPAESGSADPFMQLAGRPRYLSMDKAKVERLKEAVFEVLAEYGRRLEALSAAERLVILACQTGDGSPFTLYTEAMEPGSLESSRQEAKDTRVTLRTAPTARMVGREAYGSVLVISVERKDLDLRDDPTALAKRARIDAYCF